MTPDVPQSTFGAKQRDALDAAFQAKNANLTTIAGLTATTDNFIQAKASAWASRTPAQVIIDLLPFIYPVGCIYFSTNSTNPATSLGFGTWGAFGAGRVPVGFSSGETEFDTDEETGGEKTHALTAAETPDNTVASDRAAGALGRASNSHTGTGDAHNNLQPYIVVRMWKRTA